MKAATRVRLLFWASTLLLGVILSVRALELRIPAMQRPFWEDELRHNEPVVNSPTMAEFDRTSLYKAMFQPRLDFWIRHDVWFPALGVSEWAMRVPALVYGMALVLLVYGVLLRFFASRVGPRWAPFLAFIASVWIAENDVQSYYSGEARHYSLIALASAIWFVVMLLYQGKPRWFLALASLLFINTHFFALPLVAAGYGLQIFREVRWRRYWWIPFHLFVCFLIYECTVRLNWVPLEALLKRPPGSKHQPLSAILNLPQLKAGLAVWKDYVDSLAVPPVTWSVWLVILGAAGLRRQSRWVTLLLTVLLILPAFFVYMRFRSTYTIGVRYFSAFFGTGVITLIAGLDVVLLEWERLAPRLAARSRQVALGLLVAAFACLFGVPAFAYHVVAERRAIHSLPENASQYFLTYSNLEHERKPVLIVQSKCGTLDITSLYFRAIVQPEAGADVNWIDVRCGNAGRARRVLHDFLARRTPAGGIIVLDQKQDQCGDRPLPPFEPPVHVEKIPGVSACLWKVSGVTNPNDLAIVANALGFSGARKLR